MYKNKNTIHIVIVVTVLLLTSLACGSSTTEQLQEAVVPTSTAEKVEVESTEEDVVDESPVEEPETEILPTETPLPTDPPPTPTPVPEPIEVTKFGFGQDERYIGFAFLVENPNQGLAFESSQYQIAFYDENDIVVETESGYIELLLPGQTLGVGGSTILDEGVTVAKMEVQLNAGDSEASEPLPTFGVESSIYQAGDYSNYVTGVINSPYNIDLSSLRVSAVLYDTEGNIVGGGFTFKNFVLANSSTGVKVSVESVGEVASVELYPTLSGLSLLMSDDEDIPDGASAIQLKKLWFWAGRP